MDQPPSASAEPSSETYHRGRRWAPGAIAGLPIALAIVVAFLRWKPFRVEIEGASMVPTLLPGDWALAVEAHRLKKGDVVVVEHPGRPGYEMVKRLTALPGDRPAEHRTLGPDEWWVEGDHPQGSTDSRHFGPVRREHLKAKVLLVYWPNDRRRLL